MGPSRKRYAFKAWWKRLIAALFDFLGGLIWILLFLRRRLPEHKDFKKILVMRIDALGDLVMTRPALSALKQAYPHAQIDMIVSSETAGLFEDAREVRRVHGMNAHWFRSQRKCSEICADKKRLKKIIRAEKYDLAIDFRGDLRNLLFLKCAGIPHVIGYGITGGSFLLSATEKYDWQAHQVQVNLKLLDTLGILSLPRVYPFNYSSARKEKFWQTLGTGLDPQAKFRMTLHTGAGLSSKCWPQESFAKLIEKTLSLPGIEIVMTGTAADKGLLPVNIYGPRVVDLRGKTALDDLPVLFDACHLHVGNDSGPGHVAAAQGISVISLFSGTNPPEVWKPWGAKTLDVLPFSSPEEVAPEQVYKKIEKIYRSAAHGS